MARSEAILVEEVRAHAYRIPTDQPESDGTLQWDSTTLVVVEIAADGCHGLGYTYGHATVARLIDQELAPMLLGCKVHDVRACWLKMKDALRNVGVPGQGEMAIAAVDVALWDLKARLLNVPLITLLGAARERVPVYGSGGFTSYSLEELERQLAGWVSQDIPRVKMKVGRDPADDPVRVQAARMAIGPQAELFVDANGAYDRKQALALAEQFAEQGVTWFEEPVSSDDVQGLRLLCQRLPAGMEVATGEYGYDAFYFQHLLSQQAVDVLQVDATRCAGITGFLNIAELAWAFNIPLSTHTAPALHLHLGCVGMRVRHIEYFHDHVRIERMLFEGMPEVQQGCLAPDLNRPGLGLVLSQAAEKYKL